MNTKPILESEYAPLRISALPSRPTASSAFGGRGYTATPLKEAFDRLPLLLIGRFNSLLADIERQGKNSLADAILTGIESGHTLTRLFEDVQSGTLATYLLVGERPLHDQITEMADTLNALTLLLGDAYEGGSHFHVDCGHPADRDEENRRSYV